MEFTKPALTFDDQVSLLLKRGMIGDPARMKRRLSAVSYYRLSGYWFHRKNPDDSFQANTHFDVVWEQYVFDRKLRLLVMDAVERIEIGIRTQLSYHHAHAHGPFGYASEPTALPMLRPGDNGSTLQRISDEIARSREPFVKHFKTKYADKHDLPPLWVATEVMTFGSVLALLRSSSSCVQDAVAKNLDVSARVLMSWLWTLNEIRNVCAHHGRLWNRVLGNKPMIPMKRHHPGWHDPVVIPNDRLFVVLTICAHVLARIAPHSAWKARAIAMVDSGGNTSPMKNMGVPVGWKQCPVWR